MTFCWQDVKNDARRVVHSTFAVPGIHQSAKTKHYTKVNARFVKRTEWAGEEGAEYQVENIYVYVEDDRLENLYRDDTIENIKTEEAYRVINTMPTIAKMLHAMVVKND